MSVFALALSLFFVFNSLGNVPVFVGLLSKFDVKKQRRIIFRELLIALFILLLFNFFGNEILTMIGISQTTIGIAGGTLLFIIALGMIFPHADKSETERSEPMIVPLAIPLVAGPGSISTVMVYAEHAGNNHWLMTAIILIAWIPTLLILLASSHIKHVLGKRGLLACQKLGGMLISLIAVQMICSGTMALLHEAFPPQTVNASERAK